MAAVQPPLCTFMYKELTIRREERSVVVDVNNLYSDDRRAVLVSHSRVVGSDLKTVEVLDLSVKWHGGLDYTSPRRVNNKSRLRVAR